MSRKKANVTDIAEQRYTLVDDPRQDSVDLIGSLDRLIRSTDALVIRRNDPLHIAIAHLLWRLAVIGVTPCRKNG